MAYQPSLYGVDALSSDASTPVVSQSPATQPRSPRDQQLTTTSRQDHLTAPELELNKSEREKFLSKWPAKQMRQRANQDQLAVLEQEFSKNPTPTQSIRERIAEDINMTERSVQIFFQNHRAKLELMAKKSPKTGKVNDNSEPMKFYPASQYKQHEYQPTPGVRDTLSPKSIEDFPEPFEFTHPKPHFLGDLRQHGHFSSSASRDSSSKDYKGSSGNLGGADYKDKIFHHLTCQSLSIGKWTRIGQNTKDLIIFYSPEKYTMTYYINYKQANYKIEYLFSYIKNIFLENTEENSNKLGGIVIELNRPPNFFMELTPKRSGFFQCVDFTENQQASYCLEHYLGGNPKVLGSQLAKLVSQESFINRHRNPLGPIHGLSYQLGFAPPTVQPQSQSTFVPPWPPQPWRDGNPPNIHRPGEHQRTSSLSRTETNTLPGEQPRRDTQQTVAIGETTALPSDSGYHSGQGTDTKSVCSFGSMGSSLGISVDFLDEFIAFFGDMLLERAGAKGWAQLVVDTFKEEEIERCLDRILKDYALELTSSTESNQQSGFDFANAASAIKLIRRYRPKISRYFQANLHEGNSNPRSTQGRLEKLSKHLTLMERIGLMEKPGTPQSNQHIQDDMEDDPVDNEDDEAISDLAPIRDFLVNGEPFRRLIVAMRRELCSNDRVQLDHITAVLKPHLSVLSCQGPEAHQQIEPTQTRRILPVPSNVFRGSRLRYRFYFESEWRPLDFLRSQFGNQIPSLGAIVTLSGSAHFAHASTSAEYLRRVWPRSGASFLSAVERAVDSALGSSNDHNYRLQEDPDKDYDIRAVISSQGTLLVDAHGSGEMMIELAQQLSWISAACSLSPTDDEKVAYCKTALVARPSSDPDSYHMRFHIGLEFERLQPIENPCWIPLFGNAAIAYGFPIPNRLGEVGLDISVPLMTALVGASHFVDFDGGIVLKGHSAMLIPTQQTNSNVQWHLVINDDPDIRLSYADGIKHCPTRLSLGNVSLETLLTSRAIIGWHTETDCMLGKPTVQYWNIHYSRAQDVSTPFGIHGASIGLQQFGVAQVDFALGPKDGKCHIRQKRPYERLICTAERVPVLLFDTGERRSWLVPASDVMLHIAQHRHCVEPYLNGEVPVEFQILDNAKESLLRNANLKLSEDEGFCFRNLIMDVWSVLEALLDHKLTRDVKVGHLIRRPFQNSISGYEFRDIVGEVPLFKLKEEKLNMTSGGWPALVQDVDALVLFANGFEDVLIPKDNSKGLCHKWKTLPKGQDFLATSIRMLIGLFDKAGCPMDREYLTTTKLQWHRGRSLLFEPCHGLSSWRCKCDRLQDVVSNNILGKVTPPGRLEEDGAVIFGALRRPVFEHSRSTAQAPDGLYSQPNVNLEPTFLSDSGNKTFSSSAGSPISSSSYSRTDTTKPSSLESDFSQDEADYGLSPVSNLALYNAKRRRGSESLQSRTDDFFSCEAFKESQHSKRARLSCLSQSRTYGYSSNSRVAREDQDLSYFP